MTTIGEDGTRMKLPPCSPANSILETNLQLAIQQQTLDMLKVMETPDGFYIVVNLRWAGQKDWYLTTRRDRSSPKLFKDLSRLNEHLKAEYPTDSLELHRNQKMPPKGKPVKPAQKGE